MDVSVPAGRLIFARSPAGDPIAECELNAAETSLIGAIAEEARSGGARLLWVHCTADLSSAGFSRRPGYRKLAADAVPQGDPLPVLDIATVLDLWPQAFIGQWGHHRVDPADEIPPGTFLGLRADGSWAGLCRAEPAGRHIDGPGFVSGSGSPDATRRLVAGACAYLGPGPATLETWGDPAEQYEALGFRTIEECGGWEMTLVR